MLKKRTGPIIWSDRKSPLSQEQLDFFQKNGFLILTNYLNDEYTQNLLDFVVSIENNRFPSTIYESNSNNQVIRSQFNLQNSNDTFRQLLLAPKVRKIAQQLLGESVYIHQCHANYKKARIGKEYYWHSDFAYWYWEDGMAQPRAVSIVIFLDENNQKNGALQAIPGSHLWYYQNEWNRKETSPNEAVRHDFNSDKIQNGLVCDRDLQTLINKNPPELIEGKPGDIFLMEANLIHASGENKSNTDRKNLFLIYNSLENKLGEPFSGKNPRPTYISFRDYQI